MIAIIEFRPTVKAVVPHGGLKPFITPNPIAAGLPTSGDPLLIDVSTSYEHGPRLAARRGAATPGEWLIVIWAYDARSAALSTARVRCCLWAASMPGTRGLRWAC